MIKKVLVGITVLLSGTAFAAPHLLKPTWKRGFINHAQTGTLKYYGGPVVSSAKVYAVYWGASVNSGTTSQIGGFFSTILDSTYMDWLKEYATNIQGMGGQQGTDQTIGRGSYAGQFTITPSITSTALQGTDIQNELDAQITKGVLPKPDANTIFMVYFPPGVSITADGASSCQDFCAYHDNFVSKTNGNIFFGVMPDLGGMCSFGCGGSDFGTMCSISSHEMTETITDPFPTPGATPAFPQAWNDTGGNEIGDLCTDQDTTLTGGPMTYSAQQEWDNSINGCSPGPFKH